MGLHYIHPACGSGRNPSPQSTSHLLPLPTSFGAPCYPGYWLEVAWPWPPFQCCLWLLAQFGKAWGLLDPLYAHWQIAGANICHCVPIQSARILSPMPTLLWPDCTLSHLDPQPLDRGEHRTCPRALTLGHAPTDDRPVTQSIAISERIARSIALRVCS